jgi:hypothetical protein
MCRGVPTNVPIARSLSGTTRGLTANSDNLKGANMFRFSVGQRWITKDGKLRGEVIEISDEGRRGVVVITDDQNKPVDRYDGTVAGLQDPGHWQVAS